MHRGGLQDFHDLMRFRIMDVLLVASPYDSSVLEEAGHIGARVLGEYRSLALPSAPALTAVSTGEAALALLRARRFGLVICGLHLADMSGDELASKIAASGLDI